MDKYMIEKLGHRIRELEGYIHMESEPVRELCYLKKDDSRYASPGMDDSGWQDLSSGQEWGGRDQVIWIRGKIRIPQAFREQTLDLRVEAGPRESMEIKAEAMLFINGREACAFDQWHSRMRLNAETASGTDFDIALRVWSGMNRPEQMRHFQGIWLETVHKDTEKYYYLGKILFETIQELDQEDYRRIELLKNLDHSFHCVDYRNPGSEEFYKSISSAYRYLKEKYKAGNLAGGGKPTVAVCGHTHIDMAWLWRLCHTEEKGARSFSTVLHLMDRYPEYKFSQSSPLLYEMIRNHYPGLYERIKEKIGEGRWEITGGMWVEPDTNIPGGESLVRQILYGKKYIKEQFGKDTTVLWLPDVFGYSWVLPQILRKSGIRLFWTNKMSWNQYNKIPYDTFLWKGMDGSEILTQLGTCPEKDVTWGSTYNGVIAPWEIKGTWDRYQQKDINQEVLMPFGWGDGGGGPTREMLEAYEVMEDLPGIPKVKMKHVEEFAKDLEARLEQEKVPVWDGELYFEYHRGTYTSQAFVKRENRKAEVLYHDIELFASIRDILSGSKTYPAEDLERNWKQICTNQFHDIIPGSAIREVYEDAAKSYHSIRQEGEELRNRALDDITGGVRTLSGGIMVFNSLPWERSGYIKIADVPLDRVLMDGEEIVPAQYHLEEGRISAEYLLYEVPSCGYKFYRWEQGNNNFLQETIQETKVWDGKLETPYYRIGFNQSGQIIEIYDKEFRRNVLKSGGLGNELCVFEDKPHQFDAWNTEIYAYEKSHSITELEEAVIEESGPIKTVVRLIYRYNRSRICQRVTVYQHSREIRFDTQCDWHESNALLKTGFELEIRSNHATYDIQFGNLQRPTHSNTSWDYAQFEVCAHKWADLSEGNYGVTLINDCKYGWDIKDSKMRLTLIKTSSYPDEHADQGGHLFSYALFPHGLSWKEAGADRKAYEFNYPFYTREKCQDKEGYLPERFSAAGTDSKNVVLETIKKAEDGNGWIFRAYECMQYRGQVKFYFGKVPVRVAECNLMEEELAGIKTEGSGFSCEMTPYEIKTFKILFEEEKKI